MIASEYSVAYFCALDHTSILLVAMTRMLRQAGSSVHGLVMEDGLVYWSVTADARGLKDQQDLPCNHWIGLCL